MGLQKISGGPDSMWTGSIQIPSGNLKVNFIGDSVQLTLTTNPPVSLKKSSVDNQWRPGIDDRTLSSSEVLRMSGTLPPIIASITGELKRTLKQ